MDRKDHIFLFSTIIIVLIDQITKFIIQRTITQPIVLLPFLRISFVKNFGAGFSILQGQRWLLVFIAFFIIGLILYYYSLIPKIDYVVSSIAFILAGAIGNLIDRLFLGYVVDFIDFSFWPAFNIADSAITIGAIGIIFILIKNPKKKKS